MDRHYAAALITIGVLGFTGIIGGIIIICTGNDKTAGLICIGIGSNVVTGVIGIMSAPRSVTAAPLNTDDVATVAAFKAAVSKAANTISKGGQ